MKKTYHLITFGCQMNRSDSERIASVLERIGYLPTPDKNKANLIIINVCSVRQSAVDRVYGLISKIKNKKSKTRTKNQKIVLTGCLLAKDKEKLKDKVDLIFEIKDLTKLPKLLGLRNRKLKIRDYFDIIPKYSTFPFAYVPIMTGCNNFCTYCVVPYTRKREVSRPVEEIICEIKELIKKGYKMIILLGQNVNSYQGKTKNKKTVTFPKLLRLINNLKGDFWLTFVTSHPKDLSDELIETMVQSEKLMPYLHLPVQSGDDEILRRMNRHYTVSHYKNLIKKIKDKFAKIRKDICLSTDIIVGFPGETKKQFENTAKLMREIKFDMAYLAKYSPRAGTAAEKLKDDVPLKEKERRFKILAKILKKTALENNKKYLGKIVEVLIENKKENLLFGRTKTFKNLKIKCLNHQKISIGDIVKVKIKKIGAFGLEGEIKNSIK